MATDITKEATLAELRAEIERLEAELARLRSALLSAERRQSYKADSQDPRQHGAI